MHITFKVCSWSSLATEFPCNHEDSNQSWNPKAASELVFVAAQASLGECSSSPAVSWADPSPNASLSSQLSGPQPTPVNLATCRDMSQGTLDVSSSLHFFCQLFSSTSDISFLLTITFLASLQSIEISISLSPLCSPYPDPAFTCLLSCRDRQHRTKGPLNCEISCQN